MLHCLFLSFTPGPFAVPSSFFLTCARAYDPISTVVTELHFICYTISFHMDRVRIELTSPGLQGQVAPLVHADPLNRDDEI